MATKFTGLLGDALAYMQNPNRTQALQGVGGLLQSGLTSMDESQAKFRDLNKRAFGDKKNPMKVTDQEAFDQLTEMTMSGPMAFAPVGMTKDVVKGMVKEIPKKSSLLDMTRTPSEVEIQKLSREDLINWLQRNDPSGQYLDPAPSPSISMYQTARGYNIEDADTGKVFEFGDYNKAKQEFDALRYATSEFQPMTLKEAQESAINYLREFAQPAQGAKVLPLKKKSTGLLD
jgi:hypothetical protein